VLVLLSKKEKNLFTISFKESNYEKTVIDTFILGLLFNSQLKNIIAIFMIVIEFVVEALCNIANNIKS